MWPAVRFGGKAYPESVQWLQLSFVSDLSGGKDNRFTLEYGTEVEASARPRHPVAVTREDGRLEVSNGRVSLVVPRSPNILVTSR